MLLVIMLLFLFLVLLLDSISNSDDVIANVFVIIDTIIADANIDILYAVVNVTAATEMKLQLI